MPTAAPSLPVIPDDVVRLAGGPDALDHYLAIVDGRPNRALITFDGEALTLVSPKETHERTAWRADKLVAAYLGALPRSRTTAGHPTRPQLLHREFRAGAAQGGRPGDGPSSRPGRRGRGDPRSATRGSGLPGSGDSRTLATFSGDRRGDLSPTGDPRPRSRPVSPTAPQPRPAPLDRRNRRPPAVPRRPGRRR